MASTARDDAGKKEYFDSPQDLDKKVTRLAELIKSCNHFITFTGAGISTSTGIPDFRSGIDTVLDTGAGKWEKNAAIKKGIKVKKAKKQTTSLKAIPSLTHMSLVALLNAGLLKHVISQNTDGLHRRSGIHPVNLSELHGNSKLEICSNKSCGQQYLRDYKVRNSKKVHNHETGRLCISCNGKLKDTIINFKETLPEKTWNVAELNSNKADLCLVMGSSLTVTPAADLPELIGKKGRKEFRNGNGIKHFLCIVNLQKTPLDKYCQLRIFGKCDDVMKLLMEKFNIKIPKWNLTRFVRIKIISCLDKDSDDDNDEEEEHSNTNNDDNNNKKNDKNEDDVNNVFSDNYKMLFPSLKIQVNGVDSDETPATIFKSVTLTNETKYKVMTKS